MTLIRRESDYEHELVEERKRLCFTLSSIALFGELVFLEVIVDPNEIE